MPRFFAPRHLIGVTLLIVALGAHADRAQTERLLELTGMDHAIEVMAAQISQLIQAQIAQFPTDEKDSETVTRYMTEIHAMIADELTWANLKDDFVAAYDDTFSEAEIGELVTFFASPTGAKYVAEIPDLQRSALEITQRHAQTTLVPSIQRKVAELQAELSAPPHGTPPGPSGN